MSKPKLITYRACDDHVSAAVVRTQLDTKNTGGKPILEIILKVGRCVSTDEALNKLCRFSEQVTSEAHSYSLKCDRSINIWGVMREEHCWDEDCVIGGSSL